MKAYLVLDLEIHDMKGFSQYFEKIPAVIEKHAGEYVAKGEVPVVIEGDWKPETLVVIEFPSRNHAESFVRDPEAQALFPLRHKTTTSKLVLVDGCS
jgi:uncharacterized protein (DUF1330 family)